jgi:hypothetical protein
MKAASRLTTVFAVLIGLFVLGVAIAVGTLLTLQTPGLAAVAVVALAAGVLAAAITYVVVRASGMELDEDLSPPSVEMEPIESQAQVRTTAIREVELPPAYLAAVMKGLQASRASMRGPLH